MIELVDALAAYRLTRLATADVITQPARDVVIRYAYRRKGDESWIEECATPQSAVEDDDDAPKLAEFVICRWCAGMWISGFVVAARRYAPRVWDPLARALALSAGAALISRLEDE